MLSLHVSRDMTSIAAGPQSELIPTRKMCGGILPSRLKMDGLCNMLAIIYIHMFTFMEDPQQRILSTWAVSATLCLSIRVSEWSVQRLRRRPLATQKLLERRLEKLELCCVTFDFLTIVWPDRLGSFLFGCDGVGSVWARFGIGLKVVDCARWSVCAPLCWRKRRLKEEVLVCPVSARLVGELWTPYRSTFTKGSWSRC